MNIIWKLTLFAVLISACTNQIPYQSTIERPKSVENIHKRILHEAYSQGEESSRIVSIESLPPTMRGMLTPIVTVPYSYPVEAVKNGIEGWVTLIFTINTLGEPINIKVLENSGKDAFNEVSINTLKKFIYKPVVINKKIVSVSEVKYKFVFELQK
jgi:TonB family protein